MALFKCGGKRAFLTPQKGLLCSVGRSLAPDSVLEDQLCWTIDFTVMAQELHFPPLQTHSRTSSTAAVGHSLMISSLLAAPVSIVLTLLCISVPELLPALCQHSYLCSYVIEGIKELAHLGVFLGVLARSNSQIFWWTRCRRNRRAWEITEAEA